MLQLVSCKNNKQVHQTIDTDGYVVPETFQENLIYSIELQNKKGKVLSIQIDKKEYDNVNNLLKDEENDLKEITIIRITEQLSQEQLKTIRNLYEEYKEFNELFYEEVKKLGFNILIETIKTDFTLVGKTFIISGDVSEEDMAVWRTLLTEIEEKKYFAIITDNKIEVF